MKSVLISIHPKWCELIASSKKTIEVRKSKPKLEVPFKCYIYETKAVNKNKIIVDLDGDLPTVYARGKGQVIGEFVCDSITGGYWIAPFSDYLQSQSCLSYDEVCGYANGKPIFAWHISNLKIYDKPKKLGEFYMVVENEDCGKCRYYDTPCESEPCNQCQGGRKYLTRPPQSWCYVEGLGEYGQ
ncbi:MAG: hypothetical protein E7365_06065 [Clostridiales bacterium]|nr:hypothetical protein [Clostridiales bacterium]